MRGVEGGFRSGARGVLERATHSMMAAAAGPNTSNFAQSSAFADAVQRARQVFITPVLPLRPEEAGGCCGEAGEARGRAGKGGNHPSRAALRTNWSRGALRSVKGVLFGIGRSKGGIEGVHVGWEGVLIDYVLYRRQGYHHTHAY